MKAVILYALAGGGHLSAARALKTELEQQGWEGKAVLDTGVAGG